MLSSLDISERTCVASLPDFLKMDFLTEISTFLYDEVVEVDEVEL
jgi:hypothetical protein